MTVYAESNFVLELARVQEQHASCAALVALAASGTIRLAVPAYSLAEPFETLGRSSKTRSELARKVDAELRQIARSATNQTDAEALRDITGLLIRSQDEEEEHLRRVQRDLAGSADVLPLTAQVILDAQTLIETQVFDGPQDALVYATVIADLDGTAQGESVFLNRNSKDFDVPDVRSELEERGCLLIPTFDDGLRYVQSKLGL